MSSYFSGAMPKLSIAMATYNGAQYLEQMLESIRRQSIAACEVIVSDDHSTDSTCEVVEKFGEFIPIRLVMNPFRGVVSNFANALSFCTGSYIALADQDDVWLPEKLERLLEAILVAESRVGRDRPILAFCDLEIVDQDMNVISHSFFGSSIKSSNESDLSSYLLTGQMPGCAMMFNAPLLSRAMPIPDVYSHDWWLAQNAAVFGEIEYVDVPLIRYRQHSSNTIGLGRFSRKFRGLLREALSAPSLLKTRLDMAAVMVPRIRRNAEVWLARHDESSLSAEHLRLLRLIHEPPPFLRLLFHLRASRVGVRLLDYVILVGQLSRRPPNDA
jgi:glycosyltransferase involved in cell wall biosynthesis